MTKKPVLLTSKNLIKHNFINEFNSLKCVFHHQVIASLPLYSRNLYLYLCSFLQELLSHSAENGLDAKTIATLFGQVSFASIAIIAVCIVISLISKVPGAIWQMRYTVLESAEVSFFYVNEPQVHLYLVRKNE